MIDPYKNSLVAEMPVDARFHYRIRTPADTEDGRVLW